MPASVARSLIADYRVCRGKRRDSNGRDGNTFNPSRFRAGRERIVAGRPPPGGCRSYWPARQWDEPANPPVLAHRPSNAMARRPPATDPTQNRSDSGYRGWVLERAARWSCQPVQPRQSGLDCVHQSNHPPDLRVVTRSLSVFEFLRRLPPPSSGKPVHRCPGMLTPILN